MLKKNPCKSGFEVAKLDRSLDWPVTKSCPRSILKSGLSQSPYALVKMYGRIWKVWNLMLILISNSQRMEKKVHVNRRITSRVFKKTAHGLQLAFCFAVPALGLVCTSIRGKMYTRNLEIFGNNLRTRFVKVQAFKDRVGFTFTSIIYSRKANNRRVTEFVT